MQMLQGWQKQSNPATAVLARRITAGLVLVCMLAILAWLLRSPYERPTAYMTILAPKTFVNHQSETLIAKPSGGEAFDIDLANVLCRASGQRVEQTLISQLPQALLAIEGSQLKQQGQSLTSQAARVANPQSTLILYISGVLSMENQQPAICDHSDDATHGGGELLLLPLIDSLQKVACHQILLCIDLVPPSHAAPSVMAAPLIVDQLSESLEQTLSTPSGRTPVAVCIQLNSADQLVHNGATSTPLASALADALQTEAKGGELNLNRLKVHLADALQVQPASAAAIWLTSLHWPANSPRIRLPSAVGQAETTIAQKQLSETSEAKERALSRLTSRQSQSSDSTLTALSRVDVDQLEEDELWRVGSLAIEAFDCVPTVSAEELPAAWLPLPAPLSYRERRPFLVAWIEHVWHETLAVHQVSSKLPGPDRLRELVRALVSLTREAETAYQQQARATKPGAESILRDLEFSATNSWLINLCALRSNSASSAQSAIAIRSQKLLRELTDAIDQSSSAAECRSRLEKLTAKESLSALEVRQCFAACDYPVTWQTLQRVLRLQLVAQRARADLFQSSDQAQPMLMEAERLARQVRVEIDLRPDSHANSDLDALIERALRLYHAGLARMATSEQAELQKHRKLCQMLADHPWAKLQGSSGKATQRALDTFAKDWQQLFGSPSQREDKSTTSRVEEQIQVAQQLLGQSSSQREEQIEAILQLNRRAIAAAEAALTGAKESENADAPKRSDRLEHGAIRLFMRMVSSDRIRPAQAWMDDKLQEIVERNLERMQQELQGATAAEQADLQPWLNTWEQLAGSLRERGRAVNAVRRIESELSVFAPARIDMQCRASTTIPCVITYVPAESAEPEVQFEYDRQALQVTWQRQPIDRLRPIAESPIAESPTPSPNGPRTVPVSFIKQSATSNRLSSQTDLIVSVKRIADRPVREPIVVLVSHAGAQRRAVIHLDTAQTPLVNVQLLERSQPRGAGQGGGQSNRCALLPNRSQTIDLRLQSRLAAPTPVDAQVWAALNPLVDLPDGTLTLDAAQNWLKHQASLVPLAQTHNLMLDPQVDQPVALTPLPPPPGLPAGPLKCAGVLIGVTDTATKRMQLEYRALHIRHPRDYVSQHIAWNAEHQSVEVASRLVDSNAAASLTATISYRLFEWPHLSEIAHTQGQLTPTALQSHWSLSTHRSPSERFVLVTEVDGWPGTWANVIDRQQRGIGDSNIGNSVCAHLSLSSPLGDGIVATSDQEVTVDVVTWSTLPLTDDSTCLQLGWDRDRDRTLLGEALHKTNGLPSVSASFTGFDKTGSIVLESHVAPQQLKIPLAGLLNQRVSLLAVLEQDGQHRTHSELPFVIDRQAPKVIKARIENSQRCLVGAPLVVSIEADDYGLSGIARVEGAWSLDGRTQLVSDMQPLVGMWRPGAEWMLTLPTANLPSGDQLLLVRAIDRSGNASETYRCNVYLHSQAELDARARSARSVVTGSLMFATVPQSGLKVELVNVPEQKTPSEPETTPGSGDKPTEKTLDSVVVATTNSLADGRFQFNDVPTGRYQVRVSGIVRGMRIEQSRPLTVKAPEHVTPILWRLDKQP